MIGSRRLVYTTFESFFPLPARHGKPEVCQSLSSLVHLWVHGQLFLVIIEEIRNVPLPSWRHSEIWVSDFPIGAVGDEEGGGRRRRRR